METVLSMAVDNDHARSGHPRQGSTPASHVWARQLNSQTNRTEKRWESLLAVQHGRFVNAKPGLSMEEPDLEQVLPSTRPSRSCRDLNHGRPSTGWDTILKPDFLVRESQLSSRHDSYLRDEDVPGKKSQSTFYQDAITIVARAATMIHDLEPTRPHVISRTETGCAIDRGLEPEASPV